MIRPLDIGPIPKDRWYFDLVAFHGTQSTELSKPEEGPQIDIWWQQSIGASLHGLGGHAGPHPFHRSAAVLRSRGDCVYHRRSSVDLKGLDDLRRESPREWILALVLSLFQHVRHSYQLAMAVDMRTADGHWQMGSVEAGRTTVPGFLVFWFGSDLFYTNVDHFAARVRRLAMESPDPVQWLVVDAGAISSIGYTAGWAPRVGQGSCTVRHGTRFRAHKCKLESRSRAPRFSGSYRPKPAV